MSVIAICGLPGKGKTLFATYLMKKKYNRENNIIKRLITKKIFIYVFSNYPIKLNTNKKYDKKFCEAEDYSLFEVLDYKKN